MKLISKLLSQPYLYIRFLGRIHYHKHLIRNLRTHAKPSAWGSFVKIVITGTM